MQTALKTDKQVDAVSDVKPRLLIVDDVEDNRAILTRRLVRRGFEIVEAVGGHDALEKITEEVFDLVLLDVMMPDLNGNEVLKKIRERFSETELPVVMVTAKGLSENVAESIELGANDYVTKPVDFTVALARINSQLQRKRQSDAVRKEKSKVEDQAAEMRVSMEMGQARLEEESNRRQHSEEQLRYLAYHDGMTNLLNRQGFRNALSDAFEKTSDGQMETALLSIDLNLFKQVNDTYGHETGDKLLSAIGERLTAIVDKGCSIARLGGDEFAIVMVAENQPANILAVAKTVIEHLEQPFEIAGQNLVIGAACGVAHEAVGGKDADSLVKASDLAMYHAKNSASKTAVLFEPAMLDAQEKRRRMEIDLRHALNTNGMELFYQPLVDVETRKIIAFEALIRWPHPTLGMLPPDLFIPLAEEIGVIDQLGRWVIRTACEQATKWPDDISIAVNVSPLQFKDVTLLPTLVHALGATGLRPSRLELEITESTLLNLSDEILKTLTAVRELGVQISMDDFGTGYSSFGYLERFRFDKIKIDKKFVQSMGDSAENNAIVTAIVNLSKSIGARTTAEGVETEEQYGKILSEGCTQGQGYLFSRPVCADEATKLLCEL